MARSRAGWPEVLADLADLTGPRRPRRRWRTGWTRDHGCSDDPDGLAADLATAVTAAGWIPVAIVAGDCAPPPRADQADAV